MRKEETIGQTASSSSRHDDLIRTIKDYFTFSGLSGPVETMNILLSEFSEAYSDGHAYDAEYLSNKTFEVLRLNTFLVNLFEELEFINRQNKSDLL